MEIAGIFKLLGLSDAHARIYLANLEWGETSITNIARKSKIPRTSIYFLIKELLNSGLVTQSLKNGSTNYRAAPPEFLELLLIKKQQELEANLTFIKTHMNELKSINNANPQKPKVTFLEGAEGIKQAYQKTLEADELLVQCFSDNYEEIVPGDFFDKYFADLYYKKPIKSKEILPEHDQNDLEVLDSRKNLQLRVKLTGKVQTDFILFGNTVIFVSFNKEKPYALVVEDNDLANAMRTMFNLAWKQAAVNDYRIKKGVKVPVEY